MDTRTGRSRTAKWQAQRAPVQGLGLAAESASGSLPSAGAAASTISHVVAVPFVLATGLSLFDVPMHAMILIILFLAIAMLWAFEYATTNRRTAGKMPVSTALVVAPITVVAFLLARGVKPAGARDQMAAA